MPRTVLMYRNGFRLNCSQTVLMYEHNKGTRINNKKSHHMRRLHSRSKMWMVPIWIIKKKNQLK